MCCADQLNPQPTPASQRRRPNCPEAEQAHFTKERPRLGAVYCYSWCRDRFKLRDFYRLSCANSERILPQRDPDLGCLLVAAVWRFAWTAFKARNRAQVGVDGLELTVSHVLKVWPRHDLKQITIEWREQALLRYGWIGVA